MMVVHRRVASLGRVRLVYSAIASLAVMLAFSTGCQQEAPSPRAESQTAEQGVLTPSEPPTAPEGATTLPKGPKPALPAKMTARDVLDRMVAAYQKASRYADKGRLEVRYRLGAQELGDQGNFTVALDRAAGKIRLEIYGGVLVCDGQTLWAGTSRTPDQVLRVAAPAELGVESIYGNAQVADAMAGPTQGFSWLPVQLILLLADDPLKTLLYGAKEPELLQPAAIGEDSCYRVQIRRDDGTGTFWIDQDDYVLRRFEYPPETARAIYAEPYGVAPGQIQGFSVVAQLEEAALDGPIDPRAFEFLAPPGAKYVDRFLPPELEQLGQPAPDFSFVDLEGKSITRESLAGKITVLDVWATWCGPCRKSLPELEEVYQKYKDNEEVTFLAVSVDATEPDAGRPAVEDQALRDMFKDLDVTVPIARDPKQHAGTLLGVESIPTMFILGPDGVIQGRKTGVAPSGEGPQQLAAMLEKLLAGQDVYQETLKQYERSSEGQNQHFARFVRKCVETDLFLPPTLMQQELTRAEIQERTEPTRLKMTRLWSSTELSGPGNVLAVRRPEGPPRLLVVDGGTSVAELGIDGQVDQVHPLELPEKQSITFLRTAAARDGTRYFVGAANGAQQLYLMDQDFKRLVSYPEDALENPHAGIADVQFGDLDGDGTPELCVSYWGVVGVQNVSLSGERRWANRSLSTVLRVALLGPDEGGRRNLLCTNEPGTLVTLDPEGKRLGEVRVSDFAIHFLLAADLDGDAQPELCGLSPIEQGDFVAVGLNLQGEMLWRYALPHGIHDYPIEPVTAGRLLGDARGQWIFAAADGSIHVLDADGKLVDRFNYGAPLTGLAATEWDGKRVLLVCTPQSVDAWQVEPKGP
jgi:thiol-disulfide isomerase/thioredoxin